MTTVPIVVVGVLFLAMGTVALIRPTVVLEQFGMRLGTDGADEGASGRSEVRAVYGGFGLAMAVMLAVALVVDAARTGIIWTVAAALAGMALGRVVSALAGDRTRFYPNWFYFCVEILAAGALISAVSTL